MNEKAQILATLRAELERWEGLLAGLSEAQRTAPHRPDGQSAKDVLGHLRAWQQVTLARLEAAAGEREPIMPDWVGGHDPDAEEHLEAYNAAIYETYRDQPWAAVHQAWNDGFRRLLALGEAIPEQELLDSRRYAWLNGYALIDVLKGSYEHHHFEHLEPLETWLAGQSG
jgi:hypothetical protein